MHLWRITAIAGVGLAGLSLLATFASFPFVGAVDGIEADAWPTLVPLVPVAVVAAFGDASEGIDAGPGLLLLVGTCAAIVFALVKTSDAVIATRAVASASVGIGPFGLVLGCTVAAAAVTVGIVTRRVAV